MKSATFLSMLTLVFAVSVCAAAGQSLQPGDPDQAGFELSWRMDTTRDGFVSRDEWERFFTDHDKDNDGQLSLEELRLSLRVDEEEVDDADHGRLAAFERLDANTSERALCHTMHRSCHQTAFRAECWARLMQLAT